MLDYSQSSSAMTWFYAGVRQMNTHASVRGDTNHNLFAMTTRRIYGVHHADADPSSEPSS